MVIININDILNNIFPNENSLKKSIFQLMQYLRLK